MSEVTELVMVASLVLRCTVTHLLLWMVGHLDNDGRCYTEASSVPVRREEREKSLFSLPSSGLRP